MCLVVTSCFAAACSSWVTPASVPEVRLPDRFTEATVAGPYDPSEWWKTFNDPTLNRVVEIALAENFDLAEAIARVDQAKAMERIADSSRDLLVEPSGRIDESNLPTSGSIGAQVDELTPKVPGFSIEPPERLTVTTYSINADFSYEFDFWDRKLNESQAARAKRLAAEEDYQAVRIETVAKVVRAYLEIANIRRQRELSREAVEIFREREKLGLSRYNQGLDSARDLYRVRRALWDAEATLPMVERQLADAERRLWTLLGGYREDMAELLPESLSPTVALEPVPLGIPADLLAQRPDVSAAWQRVEAARHLVNARRAALLPTLSLSGSIGLESSEREDLFNFDQWFRNLSVNLLGPIFQGSRLRDNVTLAESRLNEAVAVYGRVVVTAVNEVESALAGWKASRHFHDLRKSFVEEADAEAAHQERRYQSGLAGYEDYLTASQTLIAAKSALSMAERELGFARLRLHRSLGGPWVNSGSVLPEHSSDTGSARSTAVSAD